MGAQGPDLIDVCVALRVFEPIAVGVGPHDPGGMVGENHVFSPVLVADAGCEPHVEGGLDGFPEQADIAAFEKDRPAAVLDGLKDRIFKKFGLFVVIDARFMVDPQLNGLDVRAFLQKFFQGKVGVAVHVFSA